MIPIEQLRVGSWVMGGKDSLHPGEWMKVAEIRRQKAGFLSKDTRAIIFFDGKDSGDYFTDIDPIPLAPEVLMKCGFDKIYPSTSDRMGMDITANSLSWETDIECNSATLLDADGHEVGQTVIYLHQLQALHFWITGTELTYNHDA